MRIAVIPARGGSKRIPGKNIRPFHGKPIIAYSIEAAAESGCFDAIIVSTDDDAIADVARSYGAEVPFKRPPELSNDTIGTIPVTAHAVRWFEENRGPLDLACCIYATAPFIRAEDIRRGLELIDSTGARLRLLGRILRFPNPAGDPDIAEWPDGHVPAGAFQHPVPGS